MQALTMAFMQFDRGVGTVRQRKAVRRENKDWEAYKAERGIQSRQALSAAEALFQGVFDEEEGEFSINNDAASHLLADGCYYLHPSSELVIEGHEDEFDYESNKNGRKAYF